MSAIGLQWLTVVRARRLQQLTAVRMQWQSRRGSQSYTSIKQLTVFSLEWLTIVSPSLQWPTVVKITTIDHGQTQYQLNCSG